MAFQPEINRGDVVSNERLCAIFGCSTQGGMRRAKKTGSLVLVSNHVESIYDDRWVDGVLHYTGMGRKKDQSLIFMQNRTLAETPSNGVEVFLFEVFKDKEYTFAGRVALAGQPYSERQPDEDGVERDVWVFPLRIAGQDLPIANKCDLDALFTRKENQARRLPDDELRQRASNAHRQPGRRLVSATQQDRSPWVAQYSKRRAMGVCDLCGEPAPFKDKDGSPYLENHHVIWLARGGEDSVMNTVALCPNCHRRMHCLDLAADREKLLALNRLRESDSVAIT